MHYFDPIKNFGILKGKATIEDGNVTVEQPKLLVTEATKKSIEQQGIDFCEIRSDVSFNNGILRFSVIANDEDWGCELQLKTPNGMFLVGVTPLMGRFAIPDGATYKFVGVPNSYDRNRPINFEIKISGSNLEFYVNDILLGEGSCVIEDYPVTFNLYGKGLRLFDVLYSTKKPLVFTVMQFTEEYNILYEDVIKPMCDLFHLDCVRGDEFFESKPILKDIIDSINNASLIIAEITPDNPNVFYEIGYAHASNKPTILLCDKKREKLPFDVSGFRTLFYENSIGGKKKVEKDLLKYLKAIFNR